jgi:outer membrane protein
MRQVTLLVVISLLIPASLLAQSSSATAGKVAVIDFQAALANNTMGKQAQDKLAGEVKKRQDDMEKTQKLLEDAQNKLRTQSNALSESAKADLSREIDRLNTELQRKNDDAQKDLQDMQQELIRPIAERLQGVVDAYAKEMGFSVVLDVMSIVWRADTSDITPEVIRRFDASLAAAPKPAAPAAPAPAAK